MKCIECRYMYTDESLDGLYICVNEKSENFGGYTGLCSEDECEDGEAWEGDFYECENKKN